MSTAYRNDFVEKAKEAEENIIKAFFVATERLGNQSAEHKTANEINMINSAVMERLTGSSTYFVDKTNHNQKGVHETAKDK